MHSVYTMGQNVKWKALIFQVTSSYLALFKFFRYLDPKNMELFKVTISGGIVVQGSEKGSKRSLDPLILEWNEGVAGLLLEWIFCIRSGIFFAISSNPFLHWFPT